MKTIDALLIGRKTYEVMLAADQTSYPGRKNYVFTHSKKKGAQSTKALAAGKRPDKNVQVVSGEAAAFVKKLNNRKARALLYSAAAISRRPSLKQI